MFSTILDGYMFRYKIAVPREIALHMKEVTTKGVTKYRDTTQSITMERELILQPKITVSLHTYVQLIQASEKYLFTLENNMVTLSSK